MSRALLVLVVLLGCRRPAPVVLNVPSAPAVVEQAGLVIQATSLVTEQGERPLEPGQPVIVVGADAPADRDTGADDPILPSAWQIALPDDTRGSVSTEAVAVRAGSLWPETVERSWPSSVGAADLDGDGAAEAWWWALTGHSELGDKFVDTQVTGHIVVSDTQGLAWQELGRSDRWGGEVPRRTAAVEATGDGGPELLVELDEHTPEVGLSGRIVRLVQYRDGALRTVFEEMVPLNVLRRVGGYAFRSIAIAPGRIEVSEVEYQLPSSCEAHRLDRADTAVDRCLSRRATIWGWDGEQFAIEQDQRGLPVRAKVGGGAISLAADPGAEDAVATLPPGTALVVRAIYDGQYPSERGHRVEVVADGGIGWAWSADLVFEDAMLRGEMTGQDEVTRAFPWVRW